MSEVVTLAGFTVNRYTLFRVFKYIVYLLLAHNAYAFFLENHAAASAVFSDGVQLGKVIRTYKDTIDTLSWVLLLVVFELETFALSDDKIRGGVKWTLNVVSALCYLSIIYSFYCYASELASVTHLLPLQQSACDLAGEGGWMLAVGQDDYVNLTAQNCAQLANSHVLRLADMQVIATVGVWTEIKWLAATDVVNSAAWLLVVVILAFDVWLQLRHELSRAMMRYSQVIKVLLYSTLLLCAIYWGINGSLLDFWDAFLWLVAFFFIEMNLFQWQAETSE